MKKYLIVAATIVASGLCLSAQANNLTETEIGTGSATPGAVLTITSYTPTPVGGGLYEYEYTFSANDSAVVGSFSVNFATAGHGVTDVLGDTLGYNINPFDVNWTFHPETSGATVSFEAYGTPTTGYAQAQDSTSWNAPGTGDVWIPGAVGVPDGGLTVALLGSAMTAMAFIRRKL